MPWKKFKPNQHYGETVTLRKDGIAMSGNFIKNQGLDAYEFVEVFADDNLHRVGFKFHKSQTPHTLKLSEESKYGRIVQSRVWKKTPWLQEILEQPTEERRFLVEIDRSIESPDKGVRYFISVGYRFRPARDFDKQGDYPRLPGVYRLFKEGALVRIGESDSIERRLKEHLKVYAKQVDAYDFCEIADISSRKAEEKRLLNEYKDAHGRLPSLNLITS
jgi:hypothetical protein